MTDTKASELVEQMREQLETAYRRAGGLPMLARTPEGRQAITNIAANEAALALQQAEARIGEAFDAGFRLACGDSCGCLDGEMPESHERDAFLSKLQSRREGDTASVAGSTDAPRFAAATETPSPTGEDE